MQVTHTYDHFFLYQEIVDIIDGYVKDYPDFVQKTVIAKTEKGRDMLAVTITDFQSGNPADKPAYLVDANIHAGEVTGSMTAMYLMDTLLTNHQDPQISDLLKHMTFYIIPRISPDGSEHYLTTPDIIRSVDRLYPYSEKKPGLYPQDIDGDGVIRKMRVKSPYGIWKKSPLDDRLMVKREPDDLVGEFYHVYQEGLIEAYDGLTVKNAPIRYGNDFNRNFPTAWQPDHIQRGAGKYPLSHPETKALADFIIDHPNIGSVLNLHTMSGLFLYPPGLKSGKEAHPEDMARYRALGAMATKETTYPALNVRDEYCGLNEGPICGLLDDFNHFGQGLVNFTIECWDLDPRAGVETKWPADPKDMTDEKQAENALKYIQFVDRELDGEGFKPWTPFNHPQLGEVEIGGIDYKSIVQNCPIKFLGQEIEKHTRFMIRQAKTLPRISFRDVKVAKMDEKTYQVEAIVMNTAFLPSYITKEALDLGKADTLKVTLLNEDVQVIGGKKTIDIGHLGGFSGIGGYNGMTGPSSSITEDCEKKVTWIIQTEKLTDIHIEVQSNKTGKIKTTYHI